jgi:CubicO group peptidase (beta-lactamase class C family)
VNQHEQHSGWGRRTLGAAAGTVALAVGLATFAADASARATRPTSSPQATQIAQIVRQAMASESLRAVIVKVMRGNQVIAEQAFGQSLTGEPATTNMYFRNGAVVFEYLSTLLLEYVDEHVVSLNDTIDRWMPNLPNANKVTLLMLANQTPGYPDFETDPGWNAAFNADPFQSWTYQSRINYAFDRPVPFAPGQNWSYAHTNFMILGEILSMIGKKPLATLLEEKVLKPMGLSHTIANDTGAMPEPTLHAYDSERRGPLNIPASSPFYEESTYWNANWGTPPGASEATTIDDMATTAIAVGTGKLLSKASYHDMTAPNLLGFGSKDPACVPSCFTQIPAYNYGIGVVRTGSWLIQNPLVGGYSASEAYLPSQKLTVAVAVTFLPGAFDSQGNYANASDTVWRLIARYLAPQDAPQLPSSS